MVPLSYNIDKLQMFPSGDYVEIVVFGNTLNFNYPIAETIKMMMGDIVLEHACKKKASVLLYRHLAFHPWHKTDEIAEKTDNYIWVSK